MKKNTQISFVLFFILFSWLPAVVLALEPPFDDKGALKSSEVIEGKQIALWIVSNSDANRWFCRENNSNKKRSAVLTDYCIFTVENSDSKNGGIVLKRKSDNKYIKKATSLGWTENKAEACVFETSNPKDNFNFSATNLNPAPEWDPGYATYLVRFTVMGTSEFLNSDVEAGFATGIGPWSAFLVYDVVRGQQEVAIADFQKTLSAARKYPLGEGLGQYKDPENVLASLLNEVGEKDPETMELDELETLTVQLKEAVQALILNMPQTGRFYRIKNCWNNKYIASYGTVNEDQTVAMVTEKEGDATVYYLTEDNRLISSMVLSLERNYISSKDGNAFCIESHPELIGAYTISDEVQNNNTLYALTDHLDWVEYDYRENSHCAWSLEEVTDAAEQPVLVKTIEGEYETLSAPVALNVPDGLEIYTIVGIDAFNCIQLLPFADKVIPAGCPVILKNVSSAKSFTFTFANGGESRENLLIANYAASEIPASVNAYALTKGEEGFGFYQLSATERTLSGHSAYLTGSDADVKAFFLEQQSTGIVRPEVVGDSADEYYDLQGRRVSTPSKGIYLTKKGKKVIFK